MSRRKKDEILLSEKYGVNPSMDCCLYCGEAKGIALLGKLPGDKEAPKEIVTNIEPCDKCKTKYNEYLLVAEVTDDKEHITGRFIAVNKLAVDEQFRPYDAVPSVHSQFEAIVKELEERQNENHQEEVGQG